MQREEDGFFEGVEMKRRVEKLFCIVALGVVAAGSAMAQIQGSIWTEGRKLDGVIRWRPAQKVYAITANNIELSLELDKVEKIEIPRPQALDVAINQINQGNAAAAIPALTKLSTDYLMMQWDLPATRYLAEAYLKSGNHAKAIEVCEKITRPNPEAAYLGEMAPIYWQALQKSGRSARVDDLVTRAIKSGDRLASAHALIMRGDLIAESGESAETTKKSLRDGYLRVVMLYRGIKSAQPEALYKAGKAFEKLGQTARADQMRTTLKSEYGASEWAGKP